MPDLVSFLQILCLDETWKIVSYPWTRRRPLSRSSSICSTILWPTFWGSAAAAVVVVVEVGPRRHLRDGHNKTFLLRSSQCLIGNVLNCKDSKVRKKHACFPLIKDCKDARSNNVASVMRKAYNKERPNF